MKKVIISQLLAGAVFLTLVAATTQTASASYTIPMPDAASTSVLMMVACAGLTAVRRFMR